MKISNGDKPLEPIPEIGMDIGLGMGKEHREHVPFPGLRALSSLRNPDFRLFYFALLGQMAAMNMQMMSRSLLVYRVSGSATILGVMALATAMPMLMFSLLGGVIADRVQKKYVLMVGQSINAVVAFVVALTLSFGYLSAEQTGSWWILLVASVFQASVMALMMPSRQAIIAEIVGEEQLMNAVALNTLGMNGFRLLAPAIAGFLIDSIGFKAIYYTMTCMYLMAVIFISRIPPTSSMSIAGRGALNDLIDGLKYIRHDATIVLILLFALFASFVSMPYMHLMPIFADDILKVGAMGMGVLFSVSGIGAVAGSIVMASLPNKKRGLMLLSSGIILGLAVMGFSFSRFWYLSLSLITLVGVGQSGRMTLSNTLLQYYVNPDYRGRVMSVYMMEFGLSSLGVFAAALLADSFGVQWSLGGIAIILTLVSLIMLGFIPRIRNLD
ncbi:MFS transporter [Thermodesulfobacteriota bacterium]